MKIKNYFSIIIGSIFLVYIFYRILSPSSSALAGDGTVGPTIGGIEITGKKESEIEAEVASYILEWKERDLIVEGMTATLTIPADMVQFDVKKTVDQFLAMTSKPWYTIWSKPDVVHIPIAVTLKEEVSGLLEEAPFFYETDTLQAIQAHASYLKSGAVTPEEVAVSKELMDRISFDIVDVSINGFGLPTIVEAIDETLILPGENFSFLEMLADGPSGYSDETANFLASVLYSNVLRADVTIQERHSQNILLDYLQPGIEVKVNAQANEDFSFRNDGVSPLLVTATVQNQQLKIELYSFATDREISYSVSKKEVEPRIIYRLSADLSAGQERVVEEGANGWQVTVYKKTIEGPYEDEKQISQDFYPPKNKVIEVSALPVQSVEGNTGSKPTEKDSESSNSTGNPGNPVETEKPTDRVKRSGT